MRAEASLQRRIALACLALAAILCTVHALVFWIGVGLLEDRLMNDRIVRASDALIRDHLAGVQRNIPGDPRVYREAEIPSALRALQPGLHEVEADGRVLHVLMRSQGQERFAIVDDESEFERIESLVWTALVAAIVLSLATAALLGATTARRVIQPVVRLSAAVLSQASIDDLPETQRQDEVGILARALAAHHERMRGFLVREQAFTGDASHELRTLLAVILGAAEVLQSRLADRPDLAPFAGRVQRTATEMADRVSALLLLSRDPASLEQPRIALAPVIEHEVERCRPLLAGKPVRFELQLDPAVMARARPELVGMAIGNLIRNACESTEEGFVRVVLGEGCVVVEDSGPGIPIELRPLVFQRFVHGSGPAAGTGLGLAIVQRICEHLGWTVGVEQQGQAGSRFVVSFGASTGTGPP